MRRRWQQGRSWGLLLPRPEPWWPQKRGLGPEAVLRPEVLERVAPLLARQWWAWHPLRGDTGAENSSVGSAHGARLVGLLVLLRVGLLALPLGDLLVPPWVRWLVDCLERGYVSS